MSDEIDAVSELCKLLEEAKLTPYFHRAGCPGGKSGTCDICQVRNRIATLEQERDAARVEAAKERETADQRTANYLAAVDERDALAAQLAAARAHLKRYWQTLADEYEDGKVPQALIDRWPRDSPLGQLHALLSDPAPAAAEYLARVREDALKEVRETVHSHVDGRFLLEPFKGAHTIDIIVRKDAREYRYEGDWLKGLRDVLGAREEQRG